MTFLTGHMKEAAPGDIIGFRKQLEDFIGKQGVDAAMPSTTDLSPFRTAFAQTRAQGLAQAKESAGNLTGSGFADIMGTAAGKSVSEEDAFLANLMNANKQANASRFLQMAGMIPGIGGQMGYQPGFLDYLMQGAKAAAPIFAGGGGKVAASAAAPMSGGTAGWNPPAVMGAYSQPAVDPNDWTNWGMGGVK